MQYMNVKCNSSTRCLPICIHTYIRTHLDSAYSSWCIHKCAFTLIQYTHVVSPANADLPGCALPGCALPGCALPGCALPGCALPGCALPGCALPGCALLCSYYVSKYQQHSLAHVSRTYILFMPNSTKYIHKVFTLTHTHTHTYVHLQMQQYPAVLVFLVYSFWVPQIYHSARYDHRKPMLKRLVQFMCAFSCTCVLIWKQIMHRKLMQSSEARGACARVYM
jgi:hypothetical protein